MFPPLHSATDTLLTHKSYPGDKKQKTIYSTMPTIGTLAARIVADPRTLNQTVVAYDGEISLGETWAIAEKVTGEDFSDYYHVSTFVHGGINRLIILFLTRRRLDS